MQMRGHKLVMSKDMENLFQLLTETEPRLWRLTVEDWWVTPLEHEKMFHAQSAWLKRDYGLLDSDP